jgi:transcriptional regulator with XRE-family HTH domain
MARKAATFGAKLAAHRARLGWSLADMAEAARVDLDGYGLGWLTRTRLGDWERGDRAPAIITQRVLLDWLATKTPKRDGR